ncbi:MAG: hypothetical protein HOZ81_10775 [Streptomyces sp.]|nr:hypothetical protein [Streptomyces sp.]NUS24266.1 hypothetical protein [Streptomyces sp.]
MSDTSLVFNLVAREEVSETLGKVKEKFDAAAAGIAAGVGAALGYGVAQSMDMSAANSKLAAQLGVGPAEAAKLSKLSADVYANNWGESTEQVNEAIKGVYQNIGDTSKAKGGLEGVTSKALALSQTFDQEVGPTTAAVGQMLKTGLAKNADEAFDIITRGFQTGVNKSDDFLDTLNEYSTQFRDLGLDGATATGILKQGLKAGARDADLVADAMKELNIRVQDQSAAQGLQQLGLNAHDMAEAFAAGGPRARDALQSITDKLRSVEDPTKRYALAQQLLGTQSEDLSKALYAIDPSKAVEGLGKVSGAADNAMKTLSNSPAAALETFKRQATVKLAEVGGVFVSFAMDHQGLFGGLAAVLGTVAAAILAVSVAQKIYATYTAIASAAQTVWNAEIWASTAALLANPMTWIVLAIIALIAVIVLIATKTTWFQQLWSTVWGAITSFTSDAVGWISDALGWFSGLGDMFAGWWGSAKHWAVTKMTELVTWVTALPGRIVAALSAMNSYLWNTTYSAFQSMKNAAVNRAVSLATWIGGLPGRLVGALSSQSYRFYNAGLDFVYGLWNGISAAGGWLWSKVANFASDYVVDPITDFLQIGSPSKLAADKIGHWIPAGIAEGAEDNAGVVDKAMRGLVDPRVYRPTTPLSTGLAPLAGAATGGAGRLDVRILVDGPEAVAKLLRYIVAVDGGGDVQAAFGSR